MNGVRKTAPFPSLSAGTYTNGILVGTPDFTARNYPNRHAEHGYLLCYNRYFEDEELADLLECIHTRIPLTDQPPVIHEPEAEVVTRRSREVQVIG